MLVIKFINDGTGDPSWLVGNYDYFVYVNSELVSQGRVENHNRISGWEGLVSRLAEQVFKNEES